MDGKERNEIPKNRKLYYKTRKLKKLQKKQKQMK